MILYLKCFKYFLTLFTLHYHYCKKKLFVFFFVIFDRNRNKLTEVHNVVCSSFLYISSLQFTIHKQSLHCEVLVLAGRVSAIKCLCLCTTASSSSCCCCTRHSSRTRKMEARVDVVFGLSRRRQREEGAKRHPRQSVVAVVVSSRGRRLFS